MIGTDDSLLIMRAQAQRHPAVGTQIASDDQLTANPVRDQVLIVYDGLVRSRTDVGGGSDGIPAAGQDLPIAGIETAGDGECGIAVHRDALACPIGVLKQYSLALCCGVRTTIALRAAGVAPVWCTQRQVCDRAPIPLDTPSN